MVVADGASRMVVWWVVALTDGGGRVLGVVQCNKCGKRRGPLGDAVVKAYIDTIKIARDMGPGSGLGPHLVRRRRWREVWSVV